MLLSLVGRFSHHLQAQFGEVGKHQAGAKFYLVNISTAEYLQGSLGLFLLDWKLRILN